MGTAATRVQCASTLCPDVDHGDSRSMNNRIEQDHPRHQEAVLPPCGGSVLPGSAERLCTAHDELRDHLRPRTHFNEPVFLSAQRRPFQERWGVMGALLQAA